MEDIFVILTNLSWRLGTKGNLYDILPIDGKLILIRLALMGRSPFERCQAFFLKELLAKKKISKSSYYSKIICKKWYQAKWKDSASNFKIYWVNRKRDLKASEEWAKTYEIFSRH